MNYSSQNIEQLFRLIGSFPNQNFSSHKHFDSIETSHSIWPNQLMNWRAKENELISTLDEIEQRSDQSTLPNLLMLSPRENQEQLHVVAEERKYSSSTWTAMVHMLDELPESSQASDFTILEVENQADLQDWLSIAERELMGGHALNPDIFQRLLNHANCSFFLGMKNDQAVATSLLFQHKQGAGIYLVATDADHRKKGYGKAITNACLQKAKALGCQRVDIQATDLGKGVYASLGFQDKGPIAVYRIARG